MITDAGRATKCRLKFEGPSISTKCTKIEWPFENMGFNGKTFRRFQTKKKQIEMHFWCRLKIISGRKTDFPLKNYFGPFFLVIPNMTSLREQLASVHVVFWTLMWKFKIVSLKPKWSTKKLFTNKVFYRWKKKISAFVLLHYSVWQTPRNNI